MRKPRATRREERRVRDAFATAAVIHLGAELETEQGHRYSIQALEEAIAVKQAGTIQDDRFVPESTAVCHCPALPKPWLHVAICMNLSGKVYPLHIWTKTEETPPEPKYFWMWGDGLERDTSTEEFQEF